MTAIIIKGKAGSSGGSLLSEYRKSSLLWLEGSDYNPTTNQWLDRSPNARILAASGGTPLPSVSNGRIRFNTSPTNQGFTVEPFINLVTTSNAINFTLLTTCYAVNAIQNNTSDRFDPVGNRAIAFSAEGFFFSSEFNRVIGGIAGNGITGSAIVNRTLTLNRQNLAWTYFFNTQNAVLYVDGQTATANYRSPFVPATNKLFIGNLTAFNSAKNAFDLSFVSVFPRALTVEQIDEVFSLLSV